MSDTPYTDQIAASPGYGRGDLIYFLRLMERQQRAVDALVRDLIESVRLSNLALEIARERGRVSALR